MKYLFFPLAIVALLMFTDCGSCTCTERACATTFVYPSVNLQLDLAGTSYVSSDFSDVLVYATDNNYKHKDTISAVLSGSVVSIDLDAFDVGDVRDSRYIISNEKLTSLDTISQISYAVNSYREICNKCSGGVNCDHEYYTVVEFVDVEVTFNGEINDSFDIPYKPE